MNKIKEKKLSSIKSQINEITNFAESSFEVKTKKAFINKKDNISNKEKDTLTLTEIVNYGPNVDGQTDDISFIKNELKIVKLMLSKQERILETVLLKIK